MKRNITLNWIFGCLLAAIVIIGLSPICSDGDCSYAAKKKQLNKTKINSYVGETVKLKVKGKKNQVKWSSTNTKVAKVTKKGKVTLKDTGKCIIKAKVGKKILKCKVVSKDHPSFNGMVEQLESVSEIGTTYKKLSAKYTWAGHIQTDSYHCFENKDNSFEFDFIGTVPGPEIEYWDDLNVGDSDRCNGMHGTAEEMLGIARSIPVSYFQKKTGLKVRSGRPEYAACLTCSGNGVTTEIVVNGYECEMFFKSTKLSGTISPKTKVFLELETYK